MESDLQQHHHHHHLHDLQHQHHQRQLNTGLTRYQSAPSSYFSSFLDSCEDFLNRPSSPETERIFARFLSNASGNTSENNNNDNISDQNLGLVRHNSPVKMEAEQQQQQTQIMQQQQTSNNQSGIMQQLQQQQQTNFSASRSFYQNQPQQNPNTGYGAINSAGMDRFPPMKMATGGNNSNLIRHSSSPAGLFTNIEIENAYVVMKGMGDYGKSNAREASFASAGRPPTTSSGPMSPISELGNKGNTGGFIEEHSNNYSTGFPVDSWDESSIMPDNVSSVKRLGKEDRTLSAGGLSAAETQNVELGNRPAPLLAHHLSLPKDLTAIEKLLQFQDTVPCKIRAKRGCATHPRSIAERVRRTKISERMRKLQDLVPNMDKQTNTADMLDLAVDYVKELQNQVKDQVLLNMQQKLDNLCEQLYFVKDQPGIRGSSVLSNGKAESGICESLGQDKINFVDCGCWLCDQHHDKFNGLVGHSVMKKPSGGDEMLQYIMNQANNETEQEERRMSDLSDWNSSVTSTTELQMNNLALEQDFLNLRKECEEKDVTIKELTTFIHSSNVTGSKRISELEEIIRRKNMIITRLKKDMVVLEQKVVQLTRLQRPSSSTSASKFWQLPAMADNLVYDMDSTSPSSSDSDSPPKNRPEAPIVKEQNSPPLQNGDNASTSNHKSAPAKVSTSLVKPTDMHTKSQPVSPLKGRSTNQNFGTLSSLGQKQLSARGDLKKSRRRTPSTSKDSAQQKRWV